VLALGECAVVPNGDPNGMWRGSSYRFDTCTGTGGGVVVADRVFSDGHCQHDFANWMLSLVSGCGMGAVPVGGVCLPG
jgi:hypothetical protein